MYRENWGKTPYHRVGRVEVVRVGLQPQPRFRRWRVRDIRRRELREEREGREKVWL